MNTQDVAKKWKVLCKQVKTLGWITELHAENVVS
tara:strand:+ start:419 stop:520 length:102 start_codon:yes stop_codon:yes gene_type:complete